MKRLVLLAIGIAAAASGPARANPAEPGPWKYTSTAGLTLTQSAYSSNWYGGDKGAIIWIIGTETTAERQFTPRFNSTNRLALAYGQTARQDTTVSGLAWESPEKSTDKIEFESVGRWTLDSYVDPYLSLKFESQFLDQSNPGETVKFNPVRLTEAAGIARVLFKTADSEGLTRVGFGLRQTISRSFGSSSTSQDGGIEWQTTITKPLLDKKVLYKGQLLVFQPLYYSKSDELESTVQANPGLFDADAADFWKTTDLNVQSTFSAGITKYLSVELFGQLVYDKFDTSAKTDVPADVLRKIRKKGQFKETLALALTYRLF